MTDDPEWSEVRGTASDKPFRLNPRQMAQVKMMSSQATHVMAYGGARSGKTFGFVRGVVIRALAYPSRHAILRYRFNHIKGSIVYDTLPKMMDLCFPGVRQACKLNKEDWFLQFPNGSEIWFGGLDDKERTEKILGQEYATIYLNECSQISWAARNMAVTRLAQNVPGLRLRMYYDCNPPGMAHWTYQVFRQNRDPDRKQALPNRGDYASLVMNPKDNEENLPAQYLDTLQGMSEAMKRRFWHGEFADASETALWSLDVIDRQRIIDQSLPDMVRVVVAVDPSGASGEEDKRSDEIGIVVVGLDREGNAYVLEDLSGRMGPAAWGVAAVNAFDRHEADCIVAEENFGGAMVAEVIRGAASSKDRKSQTPVPYRAVKASRGKVVRAEPIATLFTQGKAWLVGNFPELEDQLCAMTTSGYLGSKSPDRADAMVWAMASLFPAMTKREPSEARYVGPKINLGYSSMKRNRR